MYINFEDLEVGESFDLDGDKFIKVSRVQAEGSDPNVYMFYGTIFNFQPDDQIKII